MLGMKASSVTGIKWIDSVAVVKGGEKSYLSLNEALRDGAHG